MRLKMNNYLYAQSLSCKIRIRPCEGNKYAGEGNLILQVTIDRKTDRIPLGIRWPIHLFNEVSGELQARFKNDQLCSDYNLEIGQARTRANDICVDVRLGKTSITHEDFRSRFQNFVSKDNFADYMRTKSLSILKDGEIQTSTWKLHQSNIQRWERFAKAKEEDITFASFSKSLMMRYRTWMMDKGMEHNTITGALKITKNYLRRAEKDNFRFNKDAFEIGTTYRNGRKIGLTKEEVHLIKEELKNPAITDLERECLRKFLFMVYTGLRISDANKVNSRHINDGQLDILQYKTKHTGKKVNLKLTSYSLLLIRGRKGLIFKPVLDSLFNKTLKRICDRIGITKTVSAHVARFTFARFLYTKSGNLKAVSDLLGHTSIRTTEIYLQLDEDERGSCMSFLEEL